MPPIAVPLFGPVPGGPELLVILLIAVLLFGANKVPKLARSSGKAIGEFKKGREEVEQELEEMTGADLSDDEDPFDSSLEGDSGGSTDRE
ncbi:MAG: twin-arginine translocase TatA/TatE family subunit [Haloarculaceae archaeon]